ncbi:methyl-accepting chemotaxis protein [Colwellia psychrerythraea]|uniref:Methyl-accepting chemotaxis sensory transducer n=1 Tax=Colwellia psychrerythraea TaxID=28229 RepID=A0A099L1A2_COLPS|nr:methyl-accepting chemotaxis protein [Colwellia psychrerythraea]KGJ95922.1 methyl-accepting chemotaxis sensory transducer [Colwellia psychrerythraea]
MDRLNIKWKLGLLAILAAIGFLILITYNYLATDTLVKFNNISRHTVQLEAEMLMLRRHEKDFIARKDLKYLAKFEQTFREITLTLTQVDQQLLSVDITNNQITELKRVLTGYRNKFITLAKQQQSVGLHAKDGLYGSLRNEVHQIENLLTEREQLSGSTLDIHSLMRTMLMLRRHEKDFMLRREVKYSDKFNKRIEVMRNKLNNSEINQNFKQKTNVALDNYQQQFNKLVQGEQKLGLTSKQGIFGEMRGIIHQSETLLNAFSEFAIENIEQHINKKQRNDIVVGLCLILLVLLALTIIANGISRRITDLSTLMTLAASTKDLSLRANISGSDEISAMANIYNDMMAEFDGLMMEVKNSSLELAQASKDLKVSSEHTIAGVNRQLGDSELVVTAMTQVSDSVAEVAFNALEAATASSSAEKGSNSGHQLVTENRKSFIKLVADIESSGEIIQKLSKESNNIEAMLNDIRSIADQTNLLALNAAIEAARAGEQGRGFAVVADEVRTLAQRSAESTLEIENVVTRLQSLAAEAVSAMQLGKNQAEISVENTNNVELALSDIKKSSEAVNNMNRQIASAAEQQSTVVQEINCSLMSIAEIARDTANLSETISASSEQLQHLSDQLGHRVLKFTLSS